MGKTESADGCVVPDAEETDFDMDVIAACKLRAWMARMDRGKPLDGMDTDAPGTTAREIGGY